MHGMWLFFAWKRRGRKRKRRKKKRSVVYTFFVDNVKHALRHCRKEEEEEEKKNVSLPNIYAEKKHEGTMKD